MPIDKYGLFDDLLGGDASEGYSDNIYGSSDDFTDDQAGDAADDWLAQKELSITGSTVSDQVQNWDENLSSNNTDERQGMMTAADLQLGRFSHVSQTVQGAAQAALEGRLDVSKIGKDKIDVMAAVQGFASTTGTAPALFASRMNVTGSSDVTRYKSRADADAGVNGKVITPGYSGKDIRTALSMLGTTADDYMERGPGEALDGNHLRAEEQHKSDQYTLEGIAAVDKLADMYIDDETRGSSIYGAKKAALVGSITQRLGEARFKDDRNLALPNETGVTGIKRTMSFSGSQGTAHDRQSWLLAQDSVPGDQMWKQMPDLARSLFPIKYSKDATPEQRQHAKRTQKWQMDQAHELAETARLAIRGETPLAPNRDSAYAELANARNEAAVQDMDMSSPVAPEDNRFIVLGSKSVSPIQSMTPTYTLGPEGVPTEEQFIKAQQDFGLQEYNITNAKRLAEKMGNVQYEDLGGTGSVGRAGMYGETALSESNIYVEKLLEGTLDTEASAPVFADTDLGRYQQSIYENKPPEQGTQAWLNLRKGRVTASLAGEMITPLGKPTSMGMEKTAERLAVQRLDPTAQGFVGNSDTREGNDGERKAQLAFMAMAKHEGLGYQVEEAFFETNEGSMPGFGASPDGRVYSREGKSEGLLELKYLSPKSMEGAAQNYYPQMQMQMAVTGEDKTHFYALNKKTGEGAYEVIHADPEFQEKLKQTGQDAISLASDLDPQGVTELRKLIKSKVNKNLNVAPKDAGQEALYVPKDTKAEDPMGVYNAAKDGPLTKFNDDEMRYQSKLREMSFREAKNPDRAEMLVDLGAIKTPEPNAAEKEKAERKAGLIEVDAYKEKERREDKKDRDDRRQGLEEAKAYQEDQNRDASAVKQEEADAAKDAAKELASFTAAVKTTKGVLKGLGEIAGLVIGGTASVINEDKFSLRHSMDVGTTRGLRKVLMAEGLNEQEATGALAHAGRVTNLFNNSATGAKEYTRQSVAKGMSNLAGVRSLTIPDQIQQANWTPQDRLVWQAEALAGKTREEQSYIAKEIFGDENQLGGRATAGQLAEAYDDTIVPKVDRAFDQHRGGQEQVIWKAKEKIETAGSQGYWEGVAAEGFSLADKVASSSLGQLAMGAGGFYAASKLKNKVFGGGKAAPNKAAPSLKSAANLTAKNSSILKSSANVAKSLKGGLIAAIPHAMRYGFDVEDDGGLQDSVLDIAEMTGYGAMLGSFFGPGGTVVGGIGGAAVGALNEGYQYLTDSGDERVPSENIGRISIPNEDIKSQVNNVDVDVTIDPTGYKVETNVNGEESLDEGTGLGT